MHSPFALLLVVLAGGFAFLALSAWAAPVKSEAQPPTSSQNSVKPASKAKKNFWERLTDAGKQPSGKEVMSKVSEWMDSGHVLGKSLKDVESEYGQPSDYDYDKDINGKTIYMWSSDEPKRSYYLEFQYNAGKVHKCTVGIDTPVQDLKVIGK